MFIIKQNECHLVMTFPPALISPRGCVSECLSVSSRVPVSRVGTGGGRGTQLNSFIRKHIWEQNGSIQIPKPLGSQR